MLCLNCGKPLDGKKVYCNDVCRFSFLAKNGGQPPTYHRICKRCGKPFDTSNHLQLFCSVDCSLNTKSNKRSKYQSKNLKVFKKICPICGKEFEATYSLRRYCSKSCQLTAKRNRNLAYYHLSKGIDPPIKPTTNCTEKPSNHKDESNFDRIVREANECGLSYGNYKAQLKFGKTYEELKADYERRRKLD